MHFPIHVLLFRTRGSLCSPHPWNCAPPLPRGSDLGTPPYPWQRLLPPPAELKARGRGFSGSTLKRAGSPFHRSRDLSVPDHDKLTPPTAFSGFRLTRLPGLNHRSPLDPMRRSTGPRVQGRSHTIIASAITDSVFRIVKELHAAEQGQRGVFSVKPKRKNPGDAFCKHRPGFLGILGRCLYAVTSRMYRGRLPHKGSFKLIVAV